MFTRDLDQKDLSIPFLFRFNKISNKCFGFSFGFFLSVKKTETVKITVF